MFNVMDYLQAAKNNEVVFKNVLQDLQDNRSNRDMGYIIPEKINIQSAVEEIFKEYSTGNRRGKFTILDFKLEDETVYLSFKNVACMSGGGATLKYKTEQDGSVTYAGSVETFMS